MLFGVPIRSFVRFLVGVSFRSSFFGVSFDPRDCGHVPPILSGALPLLPKGRRQLSRGSESTVEVLAYFYHPLIV